MTRRIPVAVLGATGSVGQRFVQLLADHPWFDLAAVTASERSAGKPYGDAVDWVLEAPIPASVANLEVRPTAADLGLPLVFSALDAEVAGDLETAFAAAGAVVVSNARNHRMDSDVPLVVPEVNPDHVELARRQVFSKGAILTNPNCSTIGLVLALKPLADLFGLRRVAVTTLQALSGAGLPGVSAMRAIDNVVPFIGGEEAKLEAEPRKILGHLGADGIEPAALTVSAQCNRVAVIDGHLECVSVETVETISPDTAREAWQKFEAEPQRLDLPSAPRPVILVTDANDRPQPRLDRGAGAGMAITVGRIRPCPVLGLKFVVLSHNTIRGAAGGSILLAELAVARGLVAGISRP
jgi:aspartate-semialdehyde dehydrogenase